MLAPQLLLLSEADIHICTAYGRSALTMAAVNGYCQVCLCMRCFQQETWILLLHTFCDLQNHSQAVLPVDYSVHSNLK